MCYIRSSVACCTADARDVIEARATGTGEVVGLAAAARLAVLQAVGALDEVRCVTRHRVQTARVVVAAAVARVVGR